MIRHRLAGVLSTRRLARHCQPGTVSFSPKDETRFQPRCKAYSTAHRASSRVQSINPKSCRSAWTAASGSSVQPRIAVRAPRIRALTSTRSKRIRAAPENRGAAVRYPRQIDQHDRQVILIATGGRQRHSFGYEIDRRGGPHPAERAPRTPASATTRAATRSITSLKLLAWRLKRTAT